MLHVVVGVNTRGGVAMLCERCFSLIPSSSSCVITKCARADSYLLNRISPLVTPAVRIVWFCQQTSNECLYEGLFAVIARIMSCESGIWLLIVRIRIVSQNIWPCKAGVCLVSNPSSRLHLYICVRVHIHSYLFYMWCAVTLSLASLALGFLMACVTNTHTRKPSRLHFWRVVWHIMHIVMKFNIVDTQIIIMSLVERQ